MKNLIKNIKHWLATKIFVDEITFIAKNKANQLASQRIERWKREHVMQIADSHIISDNDLMRSNIELTYHTKDRLLQSVLRGMEQYGAIEFIERDRRDIMAREYSVRAFVYKPQDAKKV